uniref:Ubiquitin-fold modifier-conjugating enzyme 1 n=1 Tax=Timema cristinae TaxID=61476 RepID=A0A7R9CB38_TIMCR|nr:unnamed protein product [Timema cristinae]
MVDDSTKKSLSGIPLLKTKAGPRDKDLWVQRLKEEYQGLIQIPVTYPTTAPEIALPELDGKTAKMFRGGKICLSDHFKPLWARNVPRFGIAHAMALGLWGWGKQAAQYYSVLPVTNIMCWLFTSRPCTCMCPSPQAACGPHSAPDTSPSKRHHLPANLESEWCDLKLCKLYHEWLVVRARICPISDKLPRRTGQPLPSSCLYE